MAKGFTLETESRLVQSRDDWGQILNFLRNLAHLSLQFTALSLKYRYFMSLLAGEKP